MEPRIKPFILNRTDERNTKSVGGILLYAALFFIVTRIAAMLLQKSGAALYEWGWGLDAAGMLGARTPESMVSEMGWRAVPHVLLLAPFVEECAFRLGLSFRRWHIAAGLGVLAYFLPIGCCFCRRGECPLLGASGLDCRCSGGLRVYDGRVLVVETGSVAAPGDVGFDGGFCLCTPAFRFGAYLGPAALCAIVCAGALFLRVRLCLSAREPRLWMGIGCAHALQPASRVIPAGRTLRLTDEYIKLSRAPFSGARLLRCEQGYPFVLTAMRSHNHSGISFQKNTRTA